MRSSVRPLSRSPASLTNIPLDVVLEILSFLPLKSLIAARGVRSAWRQLVAKAPLISARRKFLELYDDAIASPVFLDTRNNIIPNLQPFDRPAYVATIIEKAGAVPIEFEIWLLEWPARALLSQCWPGLSSAFIHDSFTYGANLLSKRPRIHNISINQKQQPLEVPCLKLWYSGCTCDTVLVLNCDQEHLRGAIYFTDEDATEDTDDPEVRLASNWVEYQRSLLKQLSNKEVEEDYYEELEEETYSDSESSILESGI